MSLTSRKVSRTPVSKSVTSGHARLVEIVRKESKGRLCRGSFVNTHNVREDVGQAVKRRDDLFDLIGL